MLNLSSIHYLLDILAGDDILWRESKVFGRGLFGVECVDETSSYCFEKSNGLVELALSITIQSSSMEELVLSVVETVNVIFV